MVLWGAGTHAYAFNAAVPGVDHICVQSMDGQLTFFEQETFAFSRFLGSFLVPGPLCYVSKTDTFVTSTADFKVNGYKYVLEQRNRKTRIRFVALPVLCCQVSLAGGGCFQRSRRTCTRGQASSGGVRKAMSLTTVHSSASN